MDKYSYLYTYIYILIALEFVFTISFSIGKTSFFIVDLAAVTGAIRRVNNLGCAVKFEEDEEFGNEFVRSANLSISSSVFAPRRRREKIRECLFF